MRENVKQKAYDFFKKFEKKLGGLRGLHGGNSIFNVRYHLRKQLRSCKNQRNIWEKNLKCLKYKVTGL